MPSLTINNSTTTTNTVQRIGIITVTGPQGPAGTSSTGSANLSGYVPTSRQVNGHPLTGDVTVVAADIPVGIVPGAGYSNLQQFINTMHSPGLIAGAFISDAGSGNAFISPGTGMLRVADDDVSSLLFVSIPSSTVAVPADLVQRYVGFVYNTGAPTFDVRLTNNWNNDTEIALGTVLNFFGTLVISNNPFLVGDPITNIIQRFDAMAPITRDQIVGGLNLGEVGTRNIVLSAGKLWTRLNDYSVPAMNTSVANTMYSAYFNGLYWNYTTALTQWDNTSYNDISVGLVPVSVGYYTNLWFYLTVESNALGFIYDQQQYGDLTSASLASAPSFLPPNFTNGSILLGRLLFHQGATVADQIDSAFVDTFSSSPITSHNQLAGLQGGAANEYYHLRQSDYDVLTGRAGTTIVNAVDGISGQVSITGLSGITVTRSGQTLFVKNDLINSGYLTTGSANLRYYPLGSNPSGYLVSGQSFAIPLAPDYDTVENAISLTNANAAISTNQSYSPFIQQEGFGWHQLPGNSGTQSIRFRYGVRPIGVGATQSYGRWVLQSSLNSGTWFDALGVDVSGGLSAPTILSNDISTDSLVANMLRANTGSMEFGTSAGASGKFTLKSADNMGISSLAINATSGDRVLTILGDTIISGSGFAYLSNVNALSGVVTGLSGLNAANLASTGSALDTKINSLSGFTVAASGALQALIVGGGGTQVKVTGSTTLATANITGAGSVTVTLSGTQVLVSGASFVTQGQLDSVSGFGVNRDNAISGVIDNRLSLTGSGLYATITGMSGQGVTDYATKTNLTLTGSGLYTTVTGLSGAFNTQIASTGNQAWSAANNNGINLSGALSNSGTALINRDFLISGILSSGLVVTGSGLYAMITGASGQANTNFATISNLALTGQTLNALITGLSGQATGTYATIANLALTGSGLYRTITGMSGALVALIGASAAGVASINGASGVLNLQGAGSVTVTTVAQTITVSGDTGIYSTFATTTNLALTGSGLYTLVTGMSGQLNTNHATVANLALTGSGLYTLITGLSGQAVSTYATISNLALTGSGLYAQMTGFSGQANTNFATKTSLTATGALLTAVQVSGSSIINVANFTGIGGTLVFWSGGQIFISGGAGGGGGITQGQLDSLSGWAASASNLALTGSGLYALITGASGQANTNFAAITNLTQTGVQLGSTIAATGSALYALTVGLSGQAVSTYATIANLALTGSGLYVTTTGLSGAFNIQIASTGQQAWTAANTNAVILSGNATQSGVQLYNLITGMSGQDVTNYALKSSLTASGALLSAVQVTGSNIINVVNLTGINGLGVIYSGTQVFISGNNVRATGSLPIPDASFTGIGTTIVTYDGVFVRISGAPAGTGAGVTSLNTATNVVTLIGTGGLQVTNVGGNIYVSGLTTATGQQIIFMNRAGIVSGDSSMLWDENNDVLAVNKTRINTSGISVATGDFIALGTGTVVSEGGIAFQGTRTVGAGTLYITGLAGYPVAAVIQSGIGRAQSLLGPAMWSKQFTAVVPQTTNAVTTYGNTAATVGTVTTLSTEVLGQYTNFATAAAVFVVAGSAVTTPYYFRGSVTGRNGFFFSSTFSIADGPNITGAYGQPSGSRFFIGMTDQTATASVITNDPAGNRVGLSYVAASGGTQTDRYDTNWLISAKDNVTQFTGSALMNFQTGFYRFSLYAPPFAANNTGVYWQLDDLIRGSGAAGIITGNLPIGSTQLRPQTMLCAVSGGARNMRVNALYVENAGAT